jgi:hypothetical protein
MAVFRSGLWVLIVRKSIDQLVATFRLRDLQNVVALHEWLLQNGKGIEEVRRYVSRKVRRPDEPPSYFQSGLWPPPRKSREPTEWKKKLNRSQLCAYQHS